MSPQDDDAAALANDPDLRQHLLRRRRRHRVEGVRAGQRVEIGGHRWLAQRYAASRSTIADFDFAPGMDRVGWPCTNNVMVGIDITR